MHDVVIAGAGPTGLMLAGELSLAQVDVAIVERRAGQELDGSRAGGLARTIEVQGSFRSSAASRRLPPFWSDPMATSPGWATARTPDCTTR